VKLSERDKALQGAVANINKTFGNGTVIQLGKQNPEPCEVFPTGFVTADYKVIGAGGIPRKRITELYGPEGGGKTTLALHTIANAQAAGGRALFIDVEHAFNPLYAKAIGVDVGNMYMSQPDYGEQALQIAETFIDSGGIDIIVVDSVAMLTPKDEFEGEIGDARVGTLARMVSQALRKLTSKIRKANIAFIFINQIVDKIGTMGYGEQTTTTGGHKLKHIASLRLEVRKISQLKIGEKVIGSRVRLRAPKNRVGDPYQDGELDLLFGFGFSKEADVIDYGIELGVLKKEGAWYLFDGSNLEHGREKTRMLLKEHPGTYERIRQLVIEEVARRKEANDDQANQRTAE